MVNTPTDGRGYGELLKQVTEQNGAIGELQHRIAEAQASLAVLMNAIAPYAPIYRLPTETLSAIFVMGHNEECDPSKPSAGWRFTFRSSICQVSRRFRDVATQTAPLWCNLDIRLRRNMTGKLPHLYVQTCIERSKSCPLNISIEILCCCSRCSPAQCYFSIVAEHIIPHLDRVRVLEFNIGNLNEIYIPFFQEMGAAKAPLLEEYRCIVGEHNIDDWLSTSGSYHTFAGGSPRLTSITYEGRVYSSRLLPSLHTVTTLSLGGIGSYQGMSAILADFPLLDALVVGPMSVDLEDPTGKPPILVPSLRSFTTSGCESHWWCGVLQAPLLESLSIDSTITPYIHSALSIIRDTGKFPLLRSLSVETDSQPDDEEEALKTIDSQFIKATPLLTHLTLDAPFPSIEAFLPILCPTQHCDEGDSVPWPHLQSVQLDPYFEFMLSELAADRIQKGYPIGTLGMGDQVLTDGFDAEGRNVTDMIV
ncbi:hypothetical protein JAAARDRAFT_38795 [Jaapia argillacea MUCL 33604]|uniref:Uncharacterized protein n=1 Tax=Jaapia argillacea MUCL 33604 TaxID=933084 RepID=A0A067PFZ3_9AGAM|nr:hypothetical protein JAAARDRAFT_38795 [Jaapia argillacea MUCL 33604]